MLSHFMFSEDLLQCYGTGSKVWWSRAPKGCALIFVHGFAGAAVNTWSSFSTLLRQESKCAGWDIFFFGYDGLHTEVISSASKLERLLDDLASNPASVYANSSASPFSRRAHPNRYERIVLVAHSMGAILSRRAMLNGARRSPVAAWSSFTELVCFAPALSGAKVKKLIHQTLGPTMAILSLLQLLGKYVILLDVDDGALNRLHAELNSLHGNNPTLAAKAIVLAENDKVVTNGPMIPDPPARPNAVLAGQTHVSVCKPKDDFKSPLSLLLAEL